LTRPAAQVPFRNGKDSSAGLRPQADTRVLGTFSGEPNRTRDPRIVQLGIKLYF
jgi:hypothetical protein